MIKLVKGVSTHVSLFDFRSWKNAKPTIDLERSKAKKRWVNVGEEDGKGLVREPREVARKKEEEEDVATATESKREVPWTTSEYQACARKLMEENQDVILREIIGAPLPASRKKRDSTRRISAVAKVAAGQAAFIFD